MAKPKTVFTDAERDRKMIENHGNWPMWPWLPLKRKPVGGGMPGLEDKTMGVLYYSAQHKAADGTITVPVFHVYLYDPPKSKEKLMASPKTVYKTVEELLADGWVVD